MECIECPVCKSTAHTFIFGRKLYIVNPKSNFTLCDLFGCDNCNITFIINNKPKDEAPKTNIEKSQSILIKLSKGCNNILENIK